MRRVTVFGAVLVAIVVAWLCWPAQVASPAPTEASAPPADRAAPSPATAAATATAPAEPVVDAAAQRTEAPAPPPTPVALGPAFTLRGRCVDERGQPVAGATAWLLGSRADSERMAAWTKDHDEPKRLNSKATTGDDGVFELRFWPPPPFQFFLELAGKGRAT